MLHENGEHDDYGPWDQKIAALTYDEKELSGQKIAALT